MKTFLSLLIFAMLGGIMFAEDAPACYELRTYTATPGKLDALHARFRNHTVKLLGKYGMKLIGFWVPTDKAQGADNTLVYLVQHKDRATADESWKAFRADPDWIAAKAESEKDGPLTTKVESVFMSATDYSALK